MLLLTQDIHSGYGFAIGNVAAFDMGPELIVTTVNSVASHGFGGWHWVAHGGFSGKQYVEIVVFKG